MEWLAKPNEPHHSFPNRNRLSQMTVDLTVGAEKKCQVRYPLRILVGLAVSSASRPLPVELPFSAHANALKPPSHEHSGHCTWHFTTQRT
jgi:hypothetical protein